MSLTADMLETYYHPFSHKERPSLAVLSLNAHYEPSYSRIAPRIRENNSSTHTYLFDIPGEGLYVATVAESRRYMTEQAFEVRQGKVLKRDFEAMLRELRDAKAREDGFESFAARQDAIRKEQAARAAAIAEEREQATGRAQEAARKLNLPELTGTPKQVAWAEVLREDAVRQLTNAMALIDAELADKEFANSVSEASLATVAVFRENMAFVLAQNEAKFFIENRAFSYSYETLKTPSVRGRLTSYQRSAAGRERHSRW